MGRYSQNQLTASNEVGSLSTCPQTSNCACTEYPDDLLHYVEPIDLSAIPPISDISRIASIVTAMGGEIRLEQPDYLSATFKSRVFGFIDDFEIRIDHQAKRLHLRSASRVGRSDLGANKLRIDDFKKEFLSKY